MPVAVAKLMEIHDTEKKLIHAETCSKLWYYNTKYIVHETSPILIFLFTRRPYDNSKT